MSETYIERKIAIGAIVSDEFVNWLTQYYKPEYIQSQAAKLIINWCVAYADKYGQAPKQEIETIYEKKRRTVPLLKSDEDLSKYIGEILASLSEEYDSSNINIHFLIDETIKYFKQQHLENFLADLEMALEEGDVDRAESALINYSSEIVTIESEVDLHTNAEDVLEEAFSETAQPLFKYSGRLGDFLNDQLVREGFVAFLAPEKRGKSFLLLDMMLRAVKQGRKVAYFDAGDMSERKIMRRIGIYLAKKSDKAKYCDLLLIPVLDCLYNQRNTCENKQLRCHNANWGPLKEANKDYMNELKMSEIEALVELAEAKDYQPCTECLRHSSRKDVYSPSYWYKIREPVTPLTPQEAKKALESFKKRLRKSAGFKIACYPNNTLTISEIKRRLDIWSKQNWDPDIIIIDYADLLAGEKGYPKELRHVINEIWKNLRSLSQERRCLIVTATQTDAAAYEKELITLSNFSEDKRKYAHVTAMFGLNQTADEKLRGILRINELIIREDDFSVTNQVHVLQRLQIGRPVLASF